MGLTAKLRNSYRSQTGTKVFNYAVQGTTAEKEQYLAAKKAAFPGSDHTFEDGTPRFTVNEFIGGNKQIIRPTYKLIITPNNKVVIDDTADTVTRDARIEEAMVAEFARQIVAQQMGNQRNAPSAPATKIISTEELEVAAIEGGVETVPSLAGAAVGAGTEGIGD